MAFFCDGDLLLNGTTGPRIFAIDFKDPAHQVLYQVTGRGDAWPAPRRQPRRLVHHLRLRRRRRRLRGLRTRRYWITTYAYPHFTEAGHERLAATQIGQKPGEPPPGNPNDSCSDADGCSADTCVGGQACVHAPEPEGFQCAPGDQCKRGVSMCHQGKCEHQEPLNCDDANKCTDDSCDPNTGCVNQDISSVLRR